MRTMKTLVLLLGTVSLVLSLPVPSHAQALDVSGEWAVSVNTDNGQVAATLVLKQDGEKITGSIRSDMGESVIEGTMKEKTLSFAFAFPAPDGSNMTVTMTGTVDGTSIKGSYDAGGMMAGEWTATKK